MTPGGVSIIAGATTPIEGDEPSVMNRGQQHARYEAGAVIGLQMEVRHWELAPGLNHVHLVVDDHPSVPVYDVSAPIDIWGFSREKLGSELTDGWHFVRFFLCRPNHESVKTEEAFDTFSFFYGDAPPNPTADTSLPLLTYSQPRGCYAGADAGRVLLDFFVTNATLGLRDHSVRVSIDGEPVGLPITEWVPHFIGGLAPGEHTVRIELLDDRSDPVSARFAAAERTIRIAGAGAACP